MIKSFFSNKRVKSFLWRAGMMMLAALIAAISQSLNMLNLSPGAIAVLGLLLGEASKSINNRLKEQESVIQ